MSTNCIKCVKKRTGPDMLCDDCRFTLLRERVTRLTKERDYLRENLIGARASRNYERFSIGKSYQQYEKEARTVLLEDLKRIHELELGETLDGS